MSLEGQAAVKECSSWERQVDAQTAQCKTMSMCGILPISE